ncbi:MAG: hypothetical protein ACOX3T_00915 [Bdellovibrionota bacterium]
MNKKHYKFIFLLVVLNAIFASNLYAKAICKAPVFYKWKVDTSFKERNLENNVENKAKENKNTSKSSKRNNLKSDRLNLDKEEVRETYWGVVVAEGEKKEDAEKNLKYMILEKQGDVLSECKKEHGSYSECISNKYKKLKTDLEASSFTVRKQIEDAIRFDCENQVGDCIEVVKKDILCEEIKEEIKEEEEDVDNKNKKGRKDQKNASRKK